MKRRLLRWITAVMAIVFLVAQVPSTVLAEADTEEEVIVAEETTVEEPSEAENTSGEEPSEAEKTTVEEPGEAENTSGEEPSEAEKTTVEEPGEAKETTGEEPDKTEEIIEEPTRNFKLTRLAAYSTSDAKKKTIISLGSPSITGQTSSGITLKFPITVQDESGTAVNTGSKKTITLFIQGEKETKTTGKLKDGAVTLSNKFSSGEYTVYATFSGDESYQEATSESITIRVERQDLNDKLTSTPSLEGEKTGTITADGDFHRLTYYVWGGTGTEFSVEGNTIENLEGDKTYGVYAPARQEGNTYYLASDKKQIKVGVTQKQQYKVSLSAENAGWYSENTFLTSGKEIEVTEDGTISFAVFSKEENASYSYPLDTVTVTPSENATLTIDKKSDAQWNIKVSGIKGNITLTAVAKEQEKIHDGFAVTLDSAKNETGEPAVKWLQAGDGTGFILKKNADRSVYVEALDAEHYFVEDVKSEPENGAKVTYNTQTGEVLIENVTEAVTLIPVLAEKKVPDKIAIRYEFLFNGNYSEHNPAAIVNFEVTVTDQNGNPVPEATVYFKQDEKEVSPLKRTTGTDGKLSFRNSYAFGEFENQGDWVSQFALDRAFTKSVVNQDIHIVKQLAKELRIYTNQVIGTTPGQNNGKVTGVPENYEIWTGEFKQGAIVVGTGEWVHPVNGEFTGLSAGQHGIRFGEKADYENHTFYLASDYDYVTIGRGIFHVSVDENVSSHVKYSGELTQAVEPGGTVYIYVQPETGYEVSEFTVDNPSYVSGKISYDKEAGFLVIDGVSGNLIVTVKAMEVKAAKEDVANASPVKTEPDPANVPAAVKVATVEASQEAPVEVSGEKQTETVQEEPTDKQQTESEPEQPAVEEPRTQEIENITIEAEEVPKAGKITDVSEENVPGNFPYGWLLLVILAVTSGGIFIKRVSQQKKNNA